MKYPVAVRAPADDGSIESDKRDDRDGETAAVCQEHGIFRTFFFVIFMTFYVVLPLPRSFLSVLRFKKRQYACY